MSWTVTPTGQSGSEANSEVTPTSANRCTEVGVPRAGNHLPHSSMMASTADLSHTFSLTCSKPGRKPVPVGEGSKSVVGAAGRVEEAVHKRNDGLQVPCYSGFRWFQPPRSGAAATNSRSSRPLRLPSGWPPLRQVARQPIFQLPLWSRSAQKEMSFRSQFRRDFASRGRT